MKIRMRNRAAGIVIIAGVIVIIIAELVLRYGFGLGDPVLYIAHPKIEYMLKPGQDVYRFDNHIVVNNYGMRADNFPLKKEGENEIRIMVYGDSVVNGGNLTDQGDLVTEILRRKLVAGLKRKIVVGNISANSWGPGNWLAYAEQYGFFDADAVVLVISSHDYADNPTFEPFDSPMSPIKKPFCAICEGVIRYLPQVIKVPRYFPIFSKNDSDRLNFLNAHNASEPDIQKALGAVTDFLLLAKAKVARVYVFQNLERAELLSGHLKQGFARIGKLCRDLGIPTWSLQERYATAVRKRENPYRDDIHPNEVGRQLIADAIAEQLLKQFGP